MNSTVSSLLPDRAQEAHVERAGQGDGERDRERREHDSVPRVSRIAERERERDAKRVRGREGGRATPPPGRQSNRGPPGSYLPSGE